MKLIKAFLSGLNRLTFYLIIIVLSFCIAIPILNQYAVSVVQNSIEKFNNEKIHVTVKKIEIDVLLQSISLKDVTVSLRDSTIQSNIIIEKIAIQHFSIYKYLKFGKINISKASIYKPRCFVYKSDSFHQVKNEMPKSNLTPDIHFSRIVIDGMYLEYLDSTKNNSLSTIQSMDFSFSDININGDNKTKKGRPISAEINYILFKQISSNQLDKMYNLNIGRMIFIPVKQALFIDSISYLPLSEKTIFFKQMGYQTDRFIVRAKSLLINLNYKNIFTILDSIHITHLTLLHPELIVCRDRNYMRKLTIKSGIQELLRNSKSSFQVDTFGIYNGRVQYEEIPKESIVASKIWFTNFNGRIMNISSSDTINNLIVNANALLFGEGRLSTTLIFPYSNNSKSFICKGLLHNLSMKKLNPILEENLHVEIKEGNIRSMKFNFNAGNIQSNGSMQFIYDDLKIAVQNNESRKTSGIKEKIKSFMANKLLLNKSSESKKRHNDIVALHFVKDQTKFIFNYIVKTLLIGIKETIGINRKDKNSPRKKLLNRK